MFSALSRGWRRQDFPAAVGTHFGNHTCRFHGFDHTCRTVIANSQLALHRRNGSFARLSDKGNSLIIQGIVFFTAAGIGMWWLWTRWGRWHAWLVGVPVLVALGVVTADIVMNALPNLL